MALSKKWPNGEAARTCGHPSSVLTRRGACVQGTAAQEHEAGTFFAHSGGHSAIPADGCLVPLASARFFNFQ